MAKALAPIVRQPYAPENALLSRDQFIEKRRKQKELAAKMKAYEEKARAEVEGEVQETTEAPVAEGPEAPKRGRKAKV